MKAISKFSKSWLGDAEDISLVITGHFTVNNENWELIILLFMKIYISGFMLYTELFI